MPKLGRKTPCRECPFRRDAAPGWLGAETDPQNFVRAAESDISNQGALPCHLTIDYTDPRWMSSQLPKADLCAGALIYAANQAKMPRSPDRAEAVRSVEQSDAVFKYPHEFIEHHGGEITDPIYAYIKQAIDGRKETV